MTEHGTIKRTYRITMSNAGGPLERRTVEGDDLHAGAAAAKAAIEMIRGAGFLEPGDAIHITEEG
jgi:hypothetical protein